MPFINENKHDAWHNEFKKHWETEVEAVIDPQLNPTKEGLTMGEVINQVNKETHGDAIIVSDVGQHQMFTVRYADFTKTRSNVTSGGLGTMGFALPAAIGAKMGRSRARGSCVYRRRRLSNDLSRIGNNFTDRSGGQNCGIEQRIFGNGTSMATTVF